MRKILSYFSESNPKPLFILGNPKSGTTIIAKLLSKATKQSLTSDIKSITKYSPLLLEFELMNIKDFIQEHAYEFSKDIIKEPSLSFFTDDLLGLYLDSKFVWIVRNPFQNIRSILNRLKIPGNLQKINFEDYVELKKTPAWKLNLQSKMFGYKSKNYIEALAFRWNHAFNIYMQNEERIVLVKYEDFLIDKKSFIEKLALEIGFSIKDDISSHVNIQYQPKGNSNIDLKAFFGEKNYLIIETICKENMRKLGYTS
tara:strand:+ start:19268 stop:20035 length:768 start_codon:yes stop_codon:yes gene_type:complete